MDGETERSDGATPIRFRTQLELRIPKKDTTVDAIFDDNSHRIPPNTRRSTDLRIQPRGGGGPGNSKGLRPLPSTRKKKLQHIEFYAAAKETRTLY